MRRWSRIGSLVGDASALRFPIRQPRAPESGSCEPSQQREVLAHARQGRTTPVADRGRERLADVLEIPVEQRDGECVLARKVVVERALGSPSGRCDGGYARVGEAISVDEVEARLDDRVAFAVARHDANMTGRLDCVKPWKPTTRARRPPEPPRSTGRPPRAARARSPARPTATPTRKLVIGAAGRLTPCATSRVRSSTRVTVSRSEAHAAGSGRSRARVAVRAHV